MHYDFDAPPEGALKQHGERPLAVEYRSGKVPQNLTSAVTDAWLKDQVSNAKIGFRYWSKALKEGVPLAEMTFVFLESYAGVSGYDGESINFWSNRVKNSKYEPLRVFASNSNGPIAEGLWAQIKPNLPEGAKYTKFVIAYCLQLDRVVELIISAALERGMARAVAAAEAAAGRNMKWERVYMPGLVDNDHLWGFHLTGYVRVNKEGEPYDKGDLFFEPTFKAGIVNPLKSADLHAKCCVLQAAERSRHAEYTQKHAAEQGAGPTGPQYLPTSEAYTHAPAVTGSAAMPTTPPFDADDLPF